MASVYKRKRTDKATGKRVPYGKWYVAYIDHTGKRVAAPGYRDKKATQELARRLEQDAERRKAGMPVQEAADLARPFGPTVDAYLSDLETEGRSLTHRREAKRLLTTLGNECKWRTVGTITPDPLRAFVASLREAGRTPRTLNSYRDAAVAFCNWCVVQRYLTHNPLGAIPKAKERGGRKKRRRRPLTVEELKAILAAVEGKPRWWCYAVAAFSGLRRSELGRLEVRDVDLDPARPRWRLRGEATKNGEDSVVPMLPECRNNLVKWLAETRPGQTRERIFPRVPRIRTFNKDLISAGVRKENEEGRRVDFHSLRYFFAVQMALRHPLLRVKQLMRHKDIRETANVYADLGLTDAGEQEWTLPPLFAGSL